MPLKEKLGQLMMVPYFGGFTSAESPEFRALEDLVTKHHVGGLMLETRTGPLGMRRSQVYPAAALANMLQSRAKVPLLIAADFERGTAMRLEEGTSFPHAMAVAAGGRDEDAYTFGRITALEARAAGAPWIFAPVADLNSNPDNPIINVRSFGEDPARAAQFVTAFIRGAEENGAMATAKHFPGHGDTNTDSHLSLPTVETTRKHLEKVELLPFRAAISAGVGSVMTGHIAVPALDAKANTPATLSAKISTDLLRGELGFRGVVVTDALTMGGVTAQYPPGEVAVRSILAGSDVLLLSPEPEAALAALHEAVVSGRISMARIDDAVTNVLRAKARLGLHRDKKVHVDALPETFGRPEFARAAQEIADRGVTLLRDTPHLLPLDATKPLRALLVAVAGDPDPLPGQALEQELRWRADSLDVVRADTRFEPVARMRIPARETYDVLIVALFVRYADRKGTVALPDDQVAAVTGLLVSGKPTVVACFGSPYVISRFPEAATWLAGFSSADVAQRAAARAMFGQIAIGGHIPVAVPGVVSLGTGVQLPQQAMTLSASRDIEKKLAPAYKVLHRGVADHAFPGGVVAVGHNGRLAVHAFGKQSYISGASSATNTIYDAASLTKPIVTTTLAAMLVETGQLLLDATVDCYLPEWTALIKRGYDFDNWRLRVTVRHLLTHTSGLPAHQQYFETTNTRRDILRRSVNEALTYEPGAQSVYSDIGFILLGEIIERLAGAPLDQLARQRVIEPLGMVDTFFNPAKVLHKRIAPTENITALSERVSHPACTRPRQRRECARDGRRRGPRRDVLHRRRSRGFLPDAAKRRHLCAPATFATVNRLRVHRAIAAGGRSPDARMVRANCALVQRTLFLATQLRTSRLHRRIDLDRSRKAALRRAAD